jgi:hypothetical protein
MAFETAPAQTRVSSFDTPASTHIETPPPLPTLLRPFPATDPFAPSTRRLVVLVPDADTDESELAGRLWSIASAHQLTVLLISIFRDPRREPRTRRRLATLAAMLRDDIVSVETLLLADTDWLTAVRSFRRESDIIVCHAEWRIRRWTLQVESLSRRLAGEYDEPVYELSGFYPDLPLEHSGPVSRAIVFGGAILIVAIFTALEVLIHLTTQAPVHTLLMSLCVLVEYSLLGVWAYRLN